MSEMDGNNRTNTCGATINIIYSSTKNKDDSCQANKLYSIDFANHTTDSIFGTIIIKTMFFWLFSFSMTVKGA